jgi:glycosyltransferase involved in cell wall biosynthesis
MSVGVPRVSVILPTFNRASFLPEAFLSIAAQTLSDWELIIVDDGSLDDTAEVCRSFAEESHRPVLYVHQANAGAARARNTGIRRARAEYLAFFDSDDFWEPEYLSTLVGALEGAGGVDWAYAACRVEERDTGRVLHANTFHEDGRPRGFMQLATRSEGPLRVITDGGVIREALGGGLYNGFQNSVIRATCLARWDMPIVPSRIGEDTLTVVRALAAGITIGYVDEPLVRYRVHDANTSSTDLSTEKMVRNTEEYDLGYAFLIHELQSRPDVARLVRRARGSRWFWTAGYAACWRQGRRREALGFFRRGLAYWPWSVAMWKTYSLCALRVATGLGRVGRAA